MKEIRSIIYKYKWQILAVLILLIMQAICNLALPTYTSNIVNVGLEESGITSIVPSVIRESELDKLDRKFKTYYKCENKICNLNTDKDLTDEMFYPMLSLVTNEDVNVLEKEYKGNENLVRSKIINYLKEEYKLVNVDLNKMQMEYILKTGIKMIIVAIVAMGVTILTIYLTSKISAYFSRDLRSKLINKIFSLETEEMNKFSISSLITRATNDVVQISMIITTTLRTIIFAPIMAIGAIIMVSNSPMNWVIILSVTLILILMTVMFVLVVPRFNKFQTLFDRINLVSRENLTGLQVIRAFTNKKFESDKFDKANNDLVDNGLFIGTVISLAMPTLTFIMNSVAILIIWVGSYKVNSFAMQVGDLIAFITYTMQIISSFLMMSMTLMMIPRGIVSLKRLNEVLVTKKTIFDKEKTKKIKDLNIHTLEFKDVYFRYPGATEDVLRNINFEIKTGETIGFIGSTGSGKSTLVNLIPRLFDITSGSIELDGINIKDLKLKELRNIIGYVPQKGKLFKGSILDNICFGQKVKDITKATNAAKVSEILDFINNEKDGFNREVSEGGTNVSGGQKQRLSIARALAKDPKILIFDDSFSALDYKTDSKIKKSLKKITKDKIVFIVAQRITSIKDANIIVVLNDGEIESIGTHDDLLKNSPIYKEIYEGEFGGDK